LNQFAFAHSTRITVSATQNRVLRNCITRLQSWHPAYGAAAGGASGGIAG
jgi:hypothetical protein